ncbi:hypothetical protein [Synechococcus sp. BA-132 BA5]|uniref:hypothetical protein n=1 Tax=Synechococcus sp. BA-132 BA5 TaxID=3110252 RepID=UPI002B1F05A2|nr:hypothetical protein [Synechococcus sp. BA-132 BA5]
MVSRLKTGKPMIPEVAAEQSISRIGVNRDIIPEIVWEQIAQEIANMISDGLDLNPNTGDEEHLAVADQNTRRILGMNGIGN